MDNHQGHGNQCYMALLEGFDLAAMAHKCAASRPTLD
ncbi:hypothetical protein NKDENANG_02542 [Candidatus Entotheonellaceae bacterium PAL068K]